MTTARRYPGQPVSAGWTLGRLFQADAAVNQTAAARATPEQVRAAFGSVAAERSALAERLRVAGRADDAEIVAVAGLIAADPLLADAAVAAMADGKDAVAAVTQAAQEQAAVLASLGSEDLAARASDIRQIGSAVIEFLAGGLATASPAADPGAGIILVREDVAAAELIELADHGLAGAVSVAGGATSHASIIARGLGIPMLTGIDPRALAEPAGSQAILDATAGALTVSPGEAELAAAQRQTSQIIHNAIPARDSARPGQPSTTDGSGVAVLCNVASAAETRRGLAQGAAGVGLLRTEIPFTANAAWPTQAQHRAQLSPVLGLLAGRQATVRLLDFSGDKVPPFLRTAAPRSGGPQAIEPQPGGLTALLAHPTALADQLQAVLTAGQAAGAEVAVLIPMVATLAEVAQVRDLAAKLAGELGVTMPRLGIMVELQPTAQAAEAFAAHADFFSIGTNDLTSQVLAVDRQSQAASPALAADPRVLRLVGHVIDAAAAAGIAVSVCGDSAADPVVLPLLIGLGLRAVSVPAASVGQVIARIATLQAATCAAVAAQALTARSAEQVRKLVSDVLA